MGNERAKYRDYMKRPGPARYHSRALPDLLKEDRVPNRAARLGGMHVSFAGEYHYIQTVEYHGRAEPFTFVLQMTWEI